MSSPSAITFDQIRERAYELWERNHRPDGLEIEFWLTAEWELKAERNRLVCRNKTDDVLSASLG